MNTKFSSLQEAKILKKVGGYKNIVWFYDLIDLNETPSLMLSYESECSLNQYLRLRKKDVMKIVKVLEGIVICYYFSAEVPKQKL